MSKTTENINYEDLVDKIAKLGEKMHEDAFYPYQTPVSKRMIRSIITNEGARLTALFSRQGGKTTTVATTIAACMVILPYLAEIYPEEFELFSKGFWAGIFAPVGEQAATLFERVHTVLTTDTSKDIIVREFGMSIPGSGGSRGNTIKLSNGSVCRMHSANKRSKIESKTYHLIALDECVSGDTEILTTQGWVRIDAWNGQKVAVLDNDFKVFYEYPKRYIEHDDVPLFTAKCKHGLEYTTTPGHNIVYTPVSSLSIKKMDAESFWKRKNVGCRMIRSGNLENKYKLNYIDRVGIMINSDGCKYNVKQNGDIVWKLEFSKKGKIERCKYLLKKANIEYKIFREFDNSKNNTKIVFTLDNTDYKQSFRNWLPHNCGKDFIRELLHWDSYRKEKEYDDTDKNNVEFVEQICVHNNINCSPIFVKTRENKKHSTCYRLMINKHEFSFGRNNDDLEMSYGKAYCFETSTGMFFIRKNGVVLVTGNCQEMENFKIKKSISPMSSAVNGTLIATGTVNENIGFFYYEIMKNKKEDIQKSRTNKTKKHFEVDYREVQKHNKYYEKYIKNELGNHSEDTDEFKMSFKLVWPISRGLLFTKEKLEEKCYDKSIRPEMEFKESPCIAGLDVARKHDTSILTIIHPDWDSADVDGNVVKTVLDFKSFEGETWEEQYESVTEKLNNYSIETLVVDASGVGDPVTERFSIMLPNVLVVPFVFSAPEKDRAYKYLIGEIENERLVIPADSGFQKTQRFKNFEYQMTHLSKNYSGKFLSPQPIDGDKGFDDYPDSLAICVYATYYEVMPEIEEEYNNPFFSRTLSTTQPGRL